MESPPVELALGEAESFDEEDDEDDVSPDPPSDFFVVELSLLPVPDEPPERESVR